MKDLKQKHTPTRKTEDSEPKVSGFKSQVVVTLPIATEHEFNLLGNKRRKSTNKKLQGDNNKIEVLRSVTPQMQDTAEKSSKQKSN